ncbi:hypothetical protein BDA96_03G027700 [Sorghum bicolor]|jgi:predicted Ser/Thr protein kinase|uniref:Receptor-like serine/threonine-protein kinase n=1 Tax=Sorghum bicolor TaxID=4558 RepID=A0A921R940_SORBI|nr:hypothetical protein BDA96_03G027700 [Sorghum bicolor]
MPPSHLLSLLLAVTVAATVDVVHAQGIPFPTPASTNLSTSWTISLKADGHGAQSFDYMDSTSVSVFLLQSIQSPPQEGLCFAACFYCVAPCEAFLFGVCIVYVDGGGFLSWPNAGSPQVVWSANRDRLVRENATLSFTAGGDLQLRNTAGGLVWSTGTSGQSVAGMTVTKSGNLVLFDRKNAAVWQSFDHPTDCLLPGQPLVEGMRLTPNASSTNWTTSNQLYLTVLSDGLYAFAESSPPQLYYQKTVTTKAGSRKTYMTLTNGSVAIFASSSSVNVSTLQPNSMINMTAGEMEYVRLESDGHLKLYRYKGIEGWPMVQDILQGQVGSCAYPTVCGAYGICVSGQCTCPTDGTATYFKQIDDRRINLGCVPVTPISCASMQDHQLLALSNVSYFNYIDTKAALPQMIDEESCKKACLQNCSCKAAFFQYGGNDTSQGSCYLPTQVFSLQVNQWQETHYSSSAYLKVQITRSPPPIPGPSNPNGTVSRSTPTRKGRIGAGVIVGSTLAGVIFVLAVIIISLMVIRRRYQSRDDEDDFGEVPGMTTRFTFEQLKVATEQFSKMIGKGGFGSVFEGQVGEQRVAVKQLDRADQGKRDFLAEVETIGNIHHINLVTLIGFCAEKSHRLLVYEYMSQGSLDRWIYSQDASMSLDWHARCRIITDIAKGLAYLHEECRQRIAHLDIKPQNILLDDNLSAKLSDFGLSKMIDRDKSQVITRMRGTPGYLAPEWLTSQITEKVDIYSFGVVVMEIISGRKNLDYSRPQESVHLISILQEKARNDQLEDLIDIHSEEMQIHKEEVIQMMRLAMWCLQIDYNKRPQMSVAVKVLEGTVNVETNIEFNFVAMVPNNLANDGKLASSAPLLASHLSGPR